MGGSALFASTILSSSGLLSAEEGLQWRSRRVGPQAAAAPAAPTPAATIRPVSATEPATLELNAPTNGQEEAPAVASVPATLPAAIAEGRPITVSRPLPPASERSASLPAGKPLVWGTSAATQPAPSQTAQHPGESANRPARIGQVVPASAEVAQAADAADPFADPFEDTSVTAAPVVIEAEPAPVAQTVQFEEEGDPFGNDGPGLGGPDLGDDLGGDEPTPYYQPEEELPPGGFQPVVPEPVRPEPAPRTPRAGSEPCDAIYLDRDTCADAAACAAAWQSFEDRTISQISLDITPHYPVDINNPDQTDALRQRQLGELAPRAWHNRDGELLATGRLENFSDSRVVIQTASGMVDLPFRQLGNDELAYLNAYWRLPAECRIEGGIYAHHEAYTVRPWTEMITFTWKASALCHKPLYFEEVQVERYGHARGPIVQPLMSGAHFFVNLAIVPYKMGINPPNECQYALGYYRPGSCAPWMIEPFPISPRGALYQAGAVVGAAVIIP